MAATQPDPTHPTWVTRAIAFVKQEESTASVEAYRSAGLGVYGLLEEVERRRQEFATRDVDLWQLDPTNQAFFLATWNAYMLQTLGEAFLDADYAADPSTVGFAPPVTVRQAEELFRDVHLWLTYAQEAQDTTQFRLDQRRSTPLPAWVEAEGGTCPPEHLLAMIAALDKIQPHAEIAAFEASQSASTRHAGALDQIRQVEAFMKAQADYARNLARGANISAGAAPQEVHEVIELRAKAAIEAAFRLGQYKAMPSLVAGDLAAGVLGGQSPDATAPQPQRVRLPRPGERGWDLWCLTDPHTLATWKRDRDAKKAIKELFEDDPDIDATLSGQEDINYALALGQIEYAKQPNGEWFPPFECCPFSAGYKNVSGQTLSLAGGQKVRPGQVFAYDVSAEQYREGTGPMKRAIVAGLTIGTGGFDYCARGGVE